jgi:hypothetical protein
MSKKEIAKTTSVAEMRKKLKKSYSFLTSPDELIKKADKKITTYLDAKDDDELDEDEMAEIEADANDAMRDIMPLFTLDNNIIASRTVGEFYQPMIIEIANQLIEEYEVKTPSEKAVVGMIAASYARYMEYSRAFNRSQKTEYLSSEKNAYFRNFAVESDRAFRQFQSGLAMLRQMKAPAMKVTVKAETAFVANNQQVNANTSESTKERIYDVNESK